MSIYDDMVYWAKIKSTLRIWLARFIRIFDKLHFNNNTAVFDNVFLSAVLLSYTNNSILNQGIEAFRASKKFLKLEFNTYICA